MIDIEIDIEILKYKSYHGHGFILIFANKLIELWFQVWKRETKFKTKY